uniref:Uncharacterized protein n=1 Tax=Arundo donax TaxID=35708 RepID=A0A0A9ETX2_ARUDO
MPRAWHSEFRMTSIHEGAFSFFFFSIWFQESSSIIWHFSSSIMLIGKETDS